MEAVDLITPQTSMEDDNKHPFTIVSYKKKQPAVHATTRGTTTTASSKEERSPVWTRSSTNQADYFYIWSVPLPHLSDYSEISRPDKGP